MEFSLSMKAELEELKIRHNAIFQMGAKDASRPACKSENKSTCETTVEMNEIESDYEGESDHNPVYNSQQVLDQLNKLELSLEVRALKVSSQNTSLGESTSVNLAPKWTYSTTLSPLMSSKNNYPSASGLCLTEQGHVPVAHPELIQNFLYPTSNSLQQKTVQYRESIRTILSEDIINNSEFKSPLLVITGPSFITDANQVKACAKWVGSLNSKTFHDLPTQMLPENVLDLYHRSNRPKLNNILLSLRTNLTKYNHGYDDPSFLRGINSIMTYEIEQGIPICRALLCELAEVCPIVGETSDTITHQYFSDLFCLGIVSNKLSESQLHRELVSGASYAVGFHTLDTTNCFDKELYTHKVTAALDAMYSSSNPHQFLSVTKIGRVAVVGTVGNDETFIILKINLELSSFEIEQIIKQIYDYPKLNATKPKIMLDVGKICNEEYELKLELLKQLLVVNIDIKYKVIGVIVDSGNNYISQNHTIDLHEIYDSNEDIDNKFYKTDDDIERKRINTDNSRHLSFSSLIHKDNYFEYFINADRFIHELDSISSLRISS